MPDSRPVVLLGPQRLSPTIGQALAAEVGPDVPVAAVTAGWEEREGELVEFRDHVRREVESLALFERAEDVFAQDAELHGAAQSLNDDLRELQKLYRIRLRHVAPAVEELLRRDDVSADFAEPEIEAAFENLRALDAHHSERVAALRAQFLEQVQPFEREHVARHRDEIRGVLAGKGAFCIAGGHVGVLFHRLWLFGVMDLVPAAMPIFAWSAGAMVLADHIVLFHDSPPEGKSYAEVWGAGFGVCPGIVPLPHAAARLDLEDPIRVQILARRFEPHTCAALEREAAMTWRDGAWTAGPTTQRLSAAGELVTI